MAETWLKGGVSNLITQEGHFTLREQQYVVFFDGTTEDEWKTALVNQSIKLDAILGEGSYLRIIPLGVSDINNDGLDEVWVHLEGLEGFSDGLIYFVDGPGPRKFRLLRTALNGM